MNRKLQRSADALRGLTRLMDMKRTQDRIYAVARDHFVMQLLAGDPKYRDPKRLHTHEHQVFSQAGQDGILQEIFRRIGVTNRTCVEFGVGVGGGFENNTAYLLAQSWSGKWIEGNEKSSDGIRRDMAFLFSAGRLSLRTGFVTAENIVEHFQGLSVPNEFDLLSIDIDGNDLWVWKALAAYRARVVVIEYNSFLPAVARWTMPYDPAWRWNENIIQFGASLKAMETAGREMGYNLVGCDLTGSDAFFVKEDLCKDRFAAPYTAENHYEPMRYYLIARPGYPRRFSASFGTVE